MDTISIVLGAIATIIAIYERVNLMRERRLHKKEKESEDKIKSMINERLTEQTEEILRRVEDNYMSNRDEEDYSYRFQAQMDILKQSVAELHRKNDDRDKAYIRKEILSFAKKLELGYTMSDLDYKNIFEFYDYYKKVLHGNSYVDDTIVYIKEKMRNK